MAEKMDRSPLLEYAAREAEDVHYEDTPAYRALKEANVLETRYRRASVDDVGARAATPRRASRGRIVSM